MCECFKFKIHSGSKFCHIKKKEEKTLRGDPDLYLYSRAIGMGMHPSFVMHMPRGELSEIIDCNLILNGYCDESIVKDDSYIDIDLK